MKSRANAQLNLPPTEVETLANGRGDRKKVAHPDLEAALLASGALIDEARERARLRRQDACALMFINEQQYSRWVAGSTNDSPSFARLLLLPPSFWFQMNKLLNQRYGLRKMAVAELLGCAADVALAVQE